MKAKFMKMKHKVSIIFKGITLFTESCETSPVSSPSYWWAVAIS